MSSPDPYSRNPKGQESAAHTFPRHEHHNQVDRLESQDTSRYIRYGREYHQREVEYPRYLPEYPHFLNYPQGSRYTINPYMVQALTQARPNTEPIQDGPRRVVYLYEYHAPLGYPATALPVSVHSVRPSLQLGLRTPHHAILNNQGNVIPIPSYVERFHVPVQQRSEDYHVIGRHDHDQDRRKEQGQPQPQDRSSYNDYGMYLLPRQAYQVPSVSDHSDSRFDRSRDTPLNTVKTKRSLQSRNTPLSLNTKLPVVTGNNPLLLSAVTDRESTATSSPSAIPSNSTIQSPALAPEVSRDIMADTTMTKWYASEWEERLKKREFVSPEEEDVWYKDLLACLDMEDVFLGPPFKCPICGKVIKRRSGHIVHVKSHIPFVKKPYVCNMCDASFFLGQHLNRHMMSHQPERNHVCHVCGKGFYRSDALRRHSQIHSCT